METKTISLADYGRVISDSELGDNIFRDIISILDESDTVTVDFSNVLSMATFCSKQIFGKLYTLLNPENFFKRVFIRNASDEMKVIIRLGIEKELEDNEKRA